MRLAPGQQIAGFPATAIRNVLRHFSEGGGRYPSLIVTRLRISEEQAEELAKELLRLGLLRRFADSGPGETALSLTTEGSRLAQARAGPPFSRALAGRRLSEFIERIPKANANVEFTYVVERAVVFGSFLTEAPSVGDVDVDVTFKSRFSDAEAALAARERSVAKAIAAGRTFPNILVQACWPMHEVVLFLRSGARVLSIHSNEGVLEDPAVARRELFPAVDSVIAAAIPPR